MLNKPLTKSSYPTRQKNDSGQQQKAAIAYKPAVLDQLIKERNQQLCQLWHWQFCLDGDAHTLNVGFLNTGKGSFFSQKEKDNCSVRKVQLFS